MSLANLTEPVLLSGDLFLAEPDPANPGQWLDWYGPIETDQLSVEPQSETVEQISRARATFGQVRSTVTLPGATALSIQFMDLPAEVMAMVLMGSLADVNQGSGTVTDEAVTARLDRWVELQFQNLAAGSVVVTDSGGGTTYSEGTDYEIEYVTGMLKARSSGAIAQGQALLVDYAYNAVAGQRVRIATESQVLRRLRLTGTNLHNDRPVLFEAHQARLRPAGAVELKGAEHLTAQLAGVLETPAGLGEPGFLTYLD